MKKVAILGSTGSIGTQTLDVIRNNSDKLTVHSLVAYSNAETLNKQVAEFCPKYHALIAREGEQCLVEAVKGADVAVVATRGIVAIECILYCLDNGIDVALANKEALVCAGALIMPKVGRAKLYPVDSEHCAISQCIASRPNGKISKILLTASGGPFWNLRDEDLKHVTPQRALAHPNWSMGAKITVDSATMMNKALEVIEASWLFGVPVNDIQIVVHRQSVVHSMVQYADGGVIAQMALPNMRLPIQYALLGDEGKFDIGSIDFSHLTLTFEKCNFEKFPCSKFGYEMANYSSIAPTVMNAANDECVDAFLSDRLSFCDFYNIILSTVKSLCGELANEPLTVANIKKYDAEARAFVKKLIDGEKC
ncbi:MAG: 1-deoxy-D-xylulose-5-phosphate reductoisomerase [Clostridiales bacterium]|nr:1-deoxy-D-xylulose-5-phosphate reductoisomerase [Clostridiales bacterium]